MKTNKVIVGAVAVAVLSLNVCAIPVSFAAGETVQISVGDDQTEAGGTFKVEVSMKDIPSKGIQACDFALKYDSSILTVTKVTQGALTNTGASSADASNSTAPVFDSEIVKGTVNLTYNTLLDDSKYWLQSGGTFCTIEGTVASNAKDGTTSIEVVPVDRKQNSTSSTANSTIFAGYVDGTESVMYDVKTSAGTVTIGSVKPTESIGATLRGDSDVDGEVTINDVVVILISVASNKPLTGQAAANADVDNTGNGVNSLDATRIQQYLASLITKAEL